MEKKGEVYSRNMYKGPMDKAKKGEGLRERCGGGWSGKSDRGKMGTTVLEQQSKKKKKEKQSK